MKTNNHEFTLSSLNCRITDLALWAVSKGRLRANLRLGVCLLALGACCDLHAAAGDLKWEFQTEGAVRSAPALGLDGTVYFGSVKNQEEGILYALDGATGSNKWQFNWKSIALGGVFPGATVGMSPVVGEDGTVYFAYGYEVVDIAPPMGTYRPCEVLGAFEGASGKVKWRSYLYGGFGQLALGADQTIFMGTTGYHNFIGYGFSALNGNTGQYKWGFNVSGFSHAPVIGRDATVYVGNGDDTAPALLALESATGNTKWKFPIGVASPAIGPDGTLYGGGDAIFYALEGATGQKRWESPLLVDLPPVIGIDGTVYVGSAGKLIALNGVTGLKVWETALEGQGSSSPLVGADGTLYVSRKEGKVLSLDGQTGAVTGEFITGGSITYSPTMGRDGTLYVGTTNGHLYAFAARSVGGLANSSWPKERGNAQNTGRVNPEALLDYQWYFNGQALPGETQATLHRATIGTNPAGRYSIMVSHSSGTVTSNAFFTLDSVSTSPSPLNGVTLFEFEAVPVAFAVQASSGLPLTYTWMKDGVALPGKSGPTWTLSHVKAGDAGDYAVVISAGGFAVRLDLESFKVDGAAMKLSSAQALGDGVFEVTWEGKVGVAYPLLVSSDLVQWSILTNVISAGERSRVLDLEAPRYPQRFYRVATFFKPVTNMALVYIKPGTFLMGSPSTEQDRSVNEGPQTQVTLTKGFWMGKYEVTQSEYLAVMGSNPSAIKRDPNCPVETVTWFNATNYCARLTQRERGAGRIPTNSVYRLPTEAEWEYACRAGTSTRFSYGDDPRYTNLKNYAWYYDISGHTTHPVGQKLPNPWGLYDMHGNVWEWCQDWYGTYRGGAAVDPQGPASGADRVIRGGNCCNSDGIVKDWRSASRGAWSPDRTDGMVKGFRVVFAPGQPWAGL
jgi:formylglycine-generating enzyme required for sulfatase activity/outer membrane protein assembly factor BamB